MRVSEWYRELNLNSVFETLGLDLKCGGHAFQATFQDTIGLSAVFPSHHAES